MSSFSTGPAMPGFTGRDTGRDPQYDQPPPAQSAQPSAGQPYYQPEAVPTDAPQPEAPRFDTMTVDDVPPVGTDPDAFEYVRMPDGTLRAIPKDQIRDIPATAVSDAPKRQAEAEREEPQFYVHLANGDVERVKESDLPGPAGANAAFGHWQREDKVYAIIGVYPVEDIVKTSKDV